MLVCICMCVSACASICLFDVCIIHVELIEYFRVILCITLTGGFSYGKPLLRGVQHGTPVIRSDERKNNVGYCLCVFVHLCVYFCEYNYVSLCLFMSVWVCLYIYVCNSQVCVAWNLLATLLRCWPICNGYLIHQHHYTSASYVLGMIWW